ncbi:MAG: asparagine N-glycosylation enzyme membrane subunit Stt3 [Candidatus Omnitrophota bacterium]|jgi:asparagine N-glycosylation enzyme membrane subunit Stt3
MPKQKRILCLILIILSAIIGTYFRLYPITVLPKIRANISAQFAVYSKIRQQIEQSIKLKLPNAPKDVLQKLTSDEFTKVLARDSSDIKDTITRTRRDMSKLNKVNQSDNFLLGADPYYYLGQTNSILNGEAENNATNGRLFLNAKMLAPIGHWYPMDFHPWVGVGVHNILNLLHLSDSVISSVQWVPLLITLTCLPLCMLSGIFIFRFSLMGSAFASTYLVISPYFLKRSLVGWYDTDPYNIFFIYAIITSLSFLMISKTFKHQIIGVSTTALAASFYALFWRGWMIPYIIILLLAFIIAFPLSGLKHISISFRRLAVYLFALCVIPIIWVGLIWGSTGIIQEFQHSYEFISGFFVSKLSVWPDVFITVGELKTPGFPKVLRLLGGSPLIAITFVGLLFTSLHKLKNKPDQSFLSLFILILLCTTIFISKNTERLILLATVPVTIGVGYGFEQIKTTISWLFSKIFVARILAPMNILTNCIAMLIMTLTLLSTSQISHAQIINFHPIYNQTWNKILTNIDKKAPLDSIITSWWSPGHFITAMANRRVSWDGATQNVPRAYWISQLFITSSESMSLGILRMLNGSGNQAIEYLTDSGMDLPSSVNLIKSTLPLNRSNGLRVYERHLSKERAAHIINLTHSIALTPSILFLYNHMIEQALALEFVGLWDFSKAEMISKLIQSDEVKINSKWLKRATPENVKLLWSLAGKPSTYQAPANVIRKSGGILIFSNGVIWNSTTKEAVLKSPAYAQGHPQAVYYEQANELVVNTYADSNSEMFIYILKHDVSSGDFYQSVILSKRMAESVMMRLYYFGGLGMKYIKAFDESINLADRTILKAFEVNWSEYIDEYERITAS